MVKPKFSFGLPYKGSKNTIAQWIIGKMPSSHTFIDLTAGGCAVAHAALLSGKFDKVVANDIRKEIPLLFKAAVTGTMPKEELFRWVSRDEFMANKETDVLVRLIWSFGNNGESYLYSRGKESYKHAMHLAIVEDKWDKMQELMPEVVDDAMRKAALAKSFHERLIEIKHCVTDYAISANQDALQHNPLYLAARRHFELHGHRGCHVSPQNLERAIRLYIMKNNSLFHADDKLICSGLDYADVIIPQNATVYADPPYAGTNCGSYKGFDHGRFYEWLRGADFPVYVSEYDMPDDFIIVGEIIKSVRSAALGIGHATERLWLHKKWI